MTGSEMKINGNNCFLPSEWHKQSGVQLTWPHGNTDWAPILAETEKCFIEIASAISHREKLLIVAPDVRSVKEKISGMVNIRNVRFFECETNDTWTRDHGAITLLKDEKPVLADFMFNGWGLKFPAQHDNLITVKSFNSGCYSSAVGFENHLNFVLEGGSIESDGQGTLLTTSECLLSLNRNGGWTKDQIGEYLTRVFGLRRILWLNHGYLAGDDTDSHIDTLARLCPRGRILYVKCSDPADGHYEALCRMEEELREFRTLDDKPYELLPLPMPDRIEYEGVRLPATYANFLIINSAVLVPTYHQEENDRKAIDIVRQAFPGREIIGINCSPLIIHHGSLHCVTMQFPEGVLE
jgi:agmatine deiminase